MKVLIHHYLLVKLGRGSDRIHDKQTEYVTQTEERLQFYHVCRMFHPMDSTVFMVRNGNSSPLCGGTEVVDFIV